MKLSFSTRGWADHSWDELVSTALEMDFSGIEIHNPIINAVFTGKGGPLERYNTQATARALRDKGLCIPALDSSVDISAGKEPPVSSVSSSWRKTMMRTLSMPHWRSLCPMRKPATSSC